MNAETLRAYGVRDLEDVQQNLDKNITKAVYRSSADLQRLRGLCAEDGTVDYECIVTNKRGNAASLLVHTEVITTLEGKRAVYTTFLDVSENESVKSEKRILNTLYQDYIAFFYLGFNQGTISILKSDKSTVLFADDGTVFATDGIMENLFLVTDAKTENGTPLSLMPLTKNEKTHIFD